jgi:hypothetical protein
MTAFESATSPKTDCGRVFHPLGFGFDLPCGKIDHSLGELGGIAWHRLFLHRSSMRRAVEESQESCEPN